MLSYKKILQCQILFFSFYLLQKKYFNRFLGLVQIIGQYSERRDVVRASCRLLVNISHYTGVTNALEKLGILEKLLDCVSIHKETKDVIESTALLLKGVYVCCLTYIFISISEEIILF